MKIYSVAYPPEPTKPGQYPRCYGVLLPTRDEAEAEQARHPGSTIKEEVVDDYSDDAREWYKLWPYAFPKPPFTVAIDNLMARYAGDAPEARAAVLESAARVLRGQR